VGDVEPPSEDVGEVEPPAEDVGDVEPPPEDAGDVEPPAEDVGEVEPPAEDVGEVEPPAEDCGDPLGESTVEGSSNDEGFNASDSEAQQEADAMAQQMARQEADAMARQEADAMARQEADAMAQQEADAMAWQEADAMAQQEADAMAQQEADAMAQQEADAMAQQEADAMARQEADAMAQQEADAMAQQEADAMARQEDENRLVVEQDEATGELKYLKPDGSEYFSNSDSSQWNEKIVHNERDEMSQANELARAEARYEYSQRNYSPESIYQDSIAPNSNFDTVVDSMGDVTDPSASSGDLNAIDTNYQLNENTADRVCEVEHTPQYSYVDDYVGDATGVPGDYPDTQTATANIEPSSESEASHSSLLDTLSAHSESSNIGRSDQPNVQQTPENETPRSSLSDRLRSVSDDVSSSETPPPPKPDDEPREPNNRVSQRWWAARGRS